MNTDPEASAPAEAPPPAAPEAPADDGPKPVPVERFNEVAHERNALREQLAAIKAQHLEAQALAEQRAAEVERLRQDHEWRGHEVDLARNGIHDPDVVEFVRYQWSKVEGDERPAFGEWFSSLRDSKPHLFGTGSAAPPRVPSTNGNAKEAPPTSAFAPEQIRAMSREEYLKHRAKIREAAGLPPEPLR